jgi:UDP-GlcNAc3NAcA epimerase
MRIVTIIGARPQFIKAAAVSAAIQKRPGLEEILVHTGQHYDHGMSAVFFEELGIAEPAFNLGVGSGSHGAQTGRALEKIDDVLQETKPAMVLVYGDTNSTLAGALAAVKLHIPVAHVEAGLRSFNRRMPEEINRIVADHVSDLLFAPTDLAVANLTREGIDQTKIQKVGDVMLDAALHFARRAEQTAKLPEALSQSGYALMTIHRAENTDDPKILTEICQFVEALAETGLQVVWPIHPRTTKALQNVPSFKPSKNILLLPPVGFLEMIRLEKGARLIMTDSGGVQKEAYFHKRPCLILRAETEWQELLETGAAVLAPPASGAKALFNKAQEAMRLNPAFPGVYGDGKASEVIASQLEQFVARRG